MKGATANSPSPVSLGLQNGPSLQIVPNPDKARKEDLTQPARQTQPKMCLRGQGLGRGILYGFAGTLIQGPGPGLESPRILSWLWVDWDGAVLVAGRDLSTHGKDFGLCDWHTGR